MIQAGAEVVIFGKPDMYEYQMREDAVLFIWTQNGGLDRE